MTCQSYPPPTRKCMKGIIARTIFDGKGMPTIEVDLVTDLGLFRAAVPSVLTKPGPYECIELRDEDPSEYLGRGVNKAIENINTIIGPELLKQEFDVTEQEKIDQFLMDLDDSEDKSKFGTNAMLAVSIAVCKAAAAKRGIPLYRHIADLAGVKDFVTPVPCFTVVFGGSNAGNKLAYKEFMILPTGATSFAEALRMGVETYMNLTEALKSKQGVGAITVGDDGAFAPPKFKTPKECLNVIQSAISKANYAGRIDIAITIGATEFFKKGKYDLNYKQKKSDPKKHKKSSDMLKDYVKFFKEFPMVVSIEDPYDQDDFEAWTALLAKLETVQIVGDTLTVSNPQRIQRAIDEKACNCIMLKLTQIGTISQAIKIHLLAKENNIGTLISHSLGETEDTFMADLVVGLSTGQIKTGAPCRSDRMAKYNQILRIEEELGKDVRYAGRAFRKPLS